MENHSGKMMIPFKIKLKNFLLDTNRMKTSLYILVCDFLGEKIASVLGISTPKYQYAIDEYYRMKREVCV